MIGRGKRPSPAGPDGLDGLFGRIDALADGAVLTAPQVAEIFGVRDRTVTAWARDGQLAGLFHSRRVGWRFTPADLRTFAKRHYHQAAPAAA
ncbi:hypothetical protein ACG83_10990 [Frankia sp. R43]|uniref:helix-turn-helix domain-containing protein n=1 Tax=Frankia sp. R43 TaxID=269536 RepID=UPI0006CA4269|nr:helix-turn-helix domain-containing protein [Frankia sp. R43]KPM55791.1 hypothetical protein ACG83_10990 [Frankia sp. R43]